MTITKEFLFYYLVLVMIDNSIKLFVGTATTVMYKNILTPICILLVPANELISGGNELLSGRNEIVSGRGDLISVVGTN